MYSAMNTVRHAIWGPKIRFQSVSAQRWVSPHSGHSVVVKVMLTKVFHIYSTLLTQPRPFDGDLFGIRNETGVATFGDS
jgi:hypothetical protein